jgi:hypothetical protein
MNHNPVVMTEIHEQITNFSAFLNEVSAAVLGGLRKIVGVIT